MRETDRNRKKVIVDLAPLYSGLLMYARILCSLYFIVRTSLLLLLMRYSSILYYIV